MFSVSIFLKALALIALFDVVFLCVMGIYQHKWLLFRIACGFVATICIAAFAAIAIPWVLR